MVKRLWLLRHGEAEPASGNKDFARELTSKGQARIQSVGRQVAAVCRPDRILCSTAIRTRQTADRFLAMLEDYGEIAYTDEIYEASVNTLLRLLNQQGKQYHELLVIGHNPGISMLVDLLSGQSFNNLNPGDLVELEFLDLEWAVIGKNTGILKSR